MQIKSVEFRNFSSYGNALQKLEFDNNGYLYLVLGGNGYGKSTIANVIIFGLYGQLDGVNLNDLPNRINKNLWVRIKVKCGNKDVVIERGIAPKLFKVEINGMLLDQARKNNIQEYLENEVFEIPYNVFKNIIILSINDFKSFLTMSPKDKRQIIDKLFGFSIINDMLEKVKTERKLLKDDILKTESELENIKKSIEVTVNKLNELEKIINKENKKKINQLKESLLKLDQDFNKLNEIKNKLIDQYSNLESEINKLNNEYSNKNSILINTKRKLKLYENDTCPECCKKLDTEFDKQKKNEYKNIINSLTDQLQKINSNISNIKTKLNENREKQNVIIAKISSLSTTMQNIKSELINISNLLKNGDSGFIQLKNLIDEFNNNKEIKNQYYSELINNDNFLSILENILGDDGVKNMAIKTILPGLNATIAQMISEMHLNFNIRFDEKFDCIITHMGENINPGTLSTGERKKADFIIIIALIKLIKLRFPQLNILFLDEIFSSVDYDGVYNILKILNNVIKEYNLNTFVINHTVLPQEIFHKKIEIYKDNGFSKFTVEIIK